MHHYPGMTERAIRKMTLREIRRAVSDIPFVNPHLATPEGSKASPSPGDQHRLSHTATDADRAQVAKYGGIAFPE